MQKQNSSIQEKQKILQPKKSFKQVIKKIQFTTYKQEYQKRKQISLRNKLRDEWLQRIKIVPPKLNNVDKENFFRTTNSFFNRQRCLNAFKHDYIRIDPLTDECELLFQKRAVQTTGPFLAIARQSIRQRKSFNENQTNLTKGRLDFIRARKLKENWKLAYRRDEMNVLRFSGSSIKDQKIGQITRFASGICQNDSLKIEPIKILYRKIVQLQNEAQFKENIEEKQIPSKNQQKKKRVLKRGKTSLLIKPHIPLERF